jgi:hypothetical protein
MKIPTLSEKERQKIICEIFAANNYLIEFTKQKLGPQGVKEYHEWMTQSVEGLRAMSWDGPLGFAMAQVTSHKNLYGSDVEGYD